MPEVIAIAAVAGNGVIGDGRTMLWHVPEDLRFFRRTTMGHPVIMGRATFEGLPSGLRGRHTIVLTRGRQRQPDGVDVAPNLEAALELAARPREGIDPRRIFVVGGAQVYAAALDADVLDRLLISEIPLEPRAADGSTDSLVRFPPIDPDRWVESAREPQSTFTLVTYRRTAPRRTSPVVPGTR